MGLTVFRRFMEFIVGWVGVSGVAVQGNQLSKNIKCASQWKVEFMWIYGV